MWLNKLQFHSFETWVHNQMHALLPQKWKDSKGLCRVWWHRKTSEHSFRDGFEAVHEELVVQKCKKEKTTTTKRFSTHRIFLSALLLKWFISRSRNWIFCEPILHCLRLLMPSLVNLLNFMSMRPKYRISRFPIFFLRRYIPQGYPTIDTFSVQHA